MRGLRNALLFLLIVGLVSVLCPGPSLHVYAEDTKTDTRPSGHYPYYDDLVEVPVSPDALTWVRIDRQQQAEMLATEADHAASIANFRLNALEAERKIREATGRSAPAPSRADLHFQVLDRIAETLDDMRNTVTNKITEVDVGLKGSPHGLSHVRFSTESYEEAHAIVRDLRDGVIKSLVVARKVRKRSHFGDAKEKKETYYVSCQDGCFITAFGY